LNTKGEKTKIEHILNKAIGVIIHLSEHKKLHKTGKNNYLKYKDADIPIYYSENIINWTEFEKYIFC
jgi:hypothetical protein